jgi:hypothetical protein
MTLVRSRVRRSFSVPNRNVENAAHFRSDSNRKESETGEPQSGLLQFHHILVAPSNIIFLLDTFLLIEAENKKIKILNIMRWLTVFGSQQKSNRNSAMLCRRVGERCEDVFLLNKRFKSKHNKMFLYHCMHEVKGYVLSTYAVPTVSDFYYYHNFPFPGQYMHTGCKK